MGQGGHVADLVKEQRPVPALLELADPLAIGSREGPALVAEHLALQQVFGDGGAVDRPERPRGAAAVVVDGPSHQFLAGAGLAKDQHRYVLGGDPADSLVDLLHGGAAADEQVRGILSHHSLRHHGRDPHQAADLESRATSSRRESSSSGFRRYS